MKNILIILAITAVFLVPMIAAEQHEDRELNAFDSNLGAEIRMLQLERNTAVNVERAEHVIDYLEETEELEEIHAELVALQEEIEEARESELSPQERAEDFTKLRQALNDISREFRLTTHEYLDESERAELRQADVSETQQEYGELVRQLVREYNSERFKEISERAGIDLSEIEERMNIDEASPEEIREEMRALRQEHGEAMRPAEEDIKQRRNEAREKGEQARGMSEEIREQTRQRAEEIREQARELSEQLREDAKDRMEERRRGPEGTPGSGNNGQGGVV